MSPHDRAGWITGIISDFIAQSPENTLQDEEKTTAWDEPLVGFSSGNDPLYREFRSITGGSHLLPEEVMAAEYPDRRFMGSDLTVISWILPQTRETKQSQRKEKQFPAEAWARARVFGEMANNALRKHLVETLRAEGHSAAAPLLSPAWKLLTESGLPVSSNWSERHAAYASGLGTFGLCDGLITEKGKAMRCGSVITTVQIPVSPRPYSSRTEYCPFFSDGSCGRCIRRCPVQAITPDGHDKQKCAEYTQVSTERYITDTYGFSGHACGLCQVKVPCESGIPKKRGGIFQILRKS
jgi:epoxyqueuosine reductase QueG